MISGQPTRKNVIDFKGIDIKTVRSGLLLLRQVDVFAVAGTKKPAELGEIPRFS